MSDRRFAGGGARTSASRQPSFLRRAARPVIESLERRQLLSAGTVDQAAAVPLTAPASSTPTAVLRLADGAVLVAAKQAGSGDLVLTRLRGDGTPDPGFGAAGHLIAHLGSGASADALAVDGAGRILAAGAVDGDLAVARFAPGVGGWQLDAKFGSGGVRTFPLAGGDETASVIALSPDGSTVAIGGTRTTAGGASEFVVAETDASGAALTTFSGDGVAATSIGTHAVLNALAFDGGSLFAGGSSDLTRDGAFAIARYQSGGDLDTAFGGGGTVVTDAFTGGTTVLGLAVQGGTLLAVGRSSSVNGGAAMARYDRLTGAPVAFGLGTSVTPVFEGGPYNFAPLAAGTDAGGGVVFAGKVDTGSGVRAGTIRLQPGANTYVVDATYAGGLGAGLTKLADVDVMSVSPDGGAAAALSTAVPGDRVVTAAGSIAPGGGVAIAAADATPRVPASGRANVVSVAGPATGSLLLGGSVTSAGRAGQMATLVRQLPDGSLDPTFGVGGVVDVNFGTADESVQGIAIDAAGRILVAGRTADGGAVARYLGNGQLDTSFAGRGVLRVGLADADVDGPVLRIATVGTDGGFVVGGTAFNDAFDTDFFVARYDATGRPVTSFGTGGVTLTNLGPGSFDTARALLVTPDGVYLGGGTSVDSGGSFVLVKYDLASGQAVHTAIDPIDGDVSITALAAANGRIYAAGTQGVNDDRYDKPDEDPQGLGERIAIAQYTAGGELNADLSSGFRVVALPPQWGGWTSVNGAHALTVDADGNLLVATTLDDGNRFAMGIVRLTPGGSVDAGYGTGGLAVVGATDFGAGGAPLDAEAGAVAVLPDRSVVVAGVTDTGTPGLRDLAVARLSAGSVDNPPVVAPIVGPGSGKQGDTLVFGGSFTDEGDAAAHAQTWSVTDASGTVVAGGAGATFAWTPDAAGTFVVTYTVTDGGGHAASARKQVVVAPSVTAVVVDGVLTVKGVAGNDVLTLTRDAQGNYVLKTTVDPARTFAAAGLSGVRIDAGDGNDWVVIDPSVTLPVEIHGGAGDDSLTGGGGDDMLFGDAGTDALLGGNGTDVVVGGDGTDVLFGGNGRDVLIGGAGADLVAGDNGDDVLIAGTTSHDADPAALAAIRAAWSADADYAARVRNLGATLLTRGDLFDDGSADLLSGDNGKDWFVADRADGDVVLDMEKKETVTDPA